MENRITKLKGNTIKRRAKDILVSEVKFVGYPFGWVNIPRTVTQISWDTRTRAYRYQRIWNKLKIEVKTLNETTHALHYGDELRNITLNTRLFTVEAGETEAESEQKKKVRIKFIAAAVIHEMSHVLQIRGWEPYYNASREDFKKS